MKSTWKKTIAAVAALPMLVTLLPAATALADESSDTDAVAQQALAAAVQQTNAKAADSNADGNLLANFNFDDLSNGATGDIADATGSAKATINGGAATVDNPGNITKAAQLSSGFWLNVTKKDGTALLKDQSSITLTYDSKATQTNQGWAFYAAPNTNAPTYRNEHYVGVMDQTKSVTMQKYNNDGERNNSGNVTATTGTDWKHVSIVITDDSSTMYINGKQQSTATPDAGRTLTEILGTEGGILQIGKANWEQGEYFNGSLDNLKIYSGALDQAAITADYNASRVEQTDEQKVQADLNALSISNADQVKSNIYLADKGAVNGSAITWTASPANIITTEAKDGKDAGVVTRPSSDTKVTLTATGTLNGATATKTIEVTVKAAVAQPKTTDYVFATFPDDRHEQIYFATSEDAMTWKDMNADVNSPSLTSTVGEQGVRDPYLFRSPEGDKFYLIATNLSTTKYGWHFSTAKPGSSTLVLWESDDLVNWSAPKLIDPGSSKIPGVGCAWAPEVMWDANKGQYMVYWASTALDEADNPLGNVNKDQMNMYYSTTRDFVHFSDPVKWVDREMSIIDTTMIKADDGYYYRASGDGQVTIERTKNPYATSTAKTAAEEKPENDPNEWSYVGTLKDIFGDWYTGSNLEGLEMFRYNADDIVKSAAGKDQPYGFLGDNYGGGVGYIPFRTSDYNSKSTDDWTNLRGKVNFGSLKKRHGSILPVTKAEREKFEAKFNQNKPQEAVTPDKDGSGPIAKYTFDNASNVGEDTVGDNDLTLKGKASQNEDSDKGKVLRLEGGTTSSEAYAEFPKGMFDGRNKLTVQMDVKSEINANHFTFTFGQNNQKYYFLKYNNSGELASRITTGSYQNEDAANATVTGNGAWHKVTVVLDDNTMTVYSDGTKVAENKSTKNKVTDLGSDLLAYLGKSFYADSYFKGAFDNVTIWNRALTADEVAQASPVEMQDIVAGTVPANPSTEVGTDDHTLVRTAKDNASKTVTTVLNQRADVKKTQVKLTFNRDAADAKVTVDGKAVTPSVSKDGTEATFTVDLSADRKISVKYGDTTTEWTLKAATVSNNPVLPGQYADPDIDYFPETGKFWIYPTTDGFSGWSGNYFHAWSSTDMVHWTDEGVILDVNKDHKTDTPKSEDYDGSKVDNIAFSPWSTGSAWAPTIESKDTDNDGKMEYFFYYCAKKSNGTSYIGVAKADNPAGPFKPADDALVSPSMEGVKVGQAIDPSIFTDDDGKSYILYGNGSAAIAELGDNMMSIKSGTVRQLTGLKGFRESVVVMKHGGKYHWTWSCDDANSPNYHVNYGVSDSLTGAITLKTEWLVGKDTANGLQGTAHQSDVTFTDGTGRERTFMAYHRHYTPLGVYTSGLGYHRETAISEITFDEDGYMQKVDVTKNIDPVQMAKTDYSKLEEAVKAAQALKESEYTADSWKAFEESGKLAAADKVLATKTAEFTAYQTEVDAATKALTEAVGKLVKAEPVNPNPGETEKPTTPSGSNDSNGSDDQGDKNQSADKSEGESGDKSADKSADGSDDGSLSNTGAAVAAVAGVAVLLAAAGVALTVLRKRRV